MVKLMFFTFLNVFLSIQQKTVHMNGAAAPGFNSLIFAPSVSLLIGTELVELLRRARNIRTTDPFCCVKQKLKTTEAFFQYLFTNMRSFVQRAQNENSTVIKTVTQP